MPGRWTLYADGAARGNPGPAGIGAVLYDPSGEITDEIAGMIGETTNNVAEYRALIAGLEAAMRRGASKLTVRLDSQLLVRQATGEYRVKAKHLQPLALRVQRLARGFDDVVFEHVPRAENAVADALANQGLDDALDP